MIQPSWHHFGNRIWRVGDNVGGLVRIFGELEASGNYWINLLERTIYDFCGFIKNDLEATAQTKNSSWNWVNIVLAVLKSCCNQTIACE
ncbi:hypothetical protein TNCV_4977491 [Trichonephila clavipes]|nr:hypothetical protein TNCV_4977491 [Trichonephila clavipes]